MRELARRVSMFSPRMEIGEADGHLFLDVTGTGRLFGSPMDIARRLCREIRDDLRLDPVWSVAPNKLTAKTATRLVKPRGGYIVSEGEEPDFMAPIPLELIPGIEKGDLERLRDFHFTSAGQVASLQLAQLEIPFGTRAGFIRDTVRGIDPSPVRMRDEAPPVIRLVHSFARHTNEPEPVENALYSLVETAGIRLREIRLACRRVAVHLEYADGVHVIRQTAANPATSIDTRLFESARSALYLAWLRRIRLRRIRLVCDRLAPPSTQIPLFSGSFRLHEERRMAVMDSIRSRFGQHAIRTGRTMCPV
jgi:DNA polymerase-4